MRARLLGVEVVRVCVLEWRCTNCVMHRARDPAAGRRRRRSMYEVRPGRKPYKVKDFKRKGGQLYLQRILYDD